MNPIEGGRGGEVKFVQIEVPVAYSIEVAS